MIGIGLFIGRSPYRSLLAKTFAWDRLGRSKPTTVWYTTLASAQVLTNAAGTAACGPHPHHRVDRDRLRRAGDARIDAVASYPPSSFGVMLALTIAASAVSATMIRSRLGRSRSAGSASRSPYTSCSTVHRTSPARSSPSKPHRHYLRPRHTGCRDSRGIRRTCRVHRHRHRARARQRCDDADTAGDGQHRRVPGPDFQAAEAVSSADGT